MQSQAMMMAYEMTDRIRANRANADKYSVVYGESVTAANNCTSSSCSPSQIALYELSQWKTAIAQSLPLGDGKIERDTSGGRPFFTISVRFQDTKIDKALSNGAGNNSMREVSIRTEI